jgi:hypothetical protein
MGFILLRILRWAGCFPLALLWLSAGETRAGETRDFLYTIGGENGGIARIQVDGPNPELIFLAPLRGGARAASVSSGKTKQRTPTGPESRIRPGNELYLFNLEPLAKGESARMETIDFDQPLHRIAPLETPGREMLLLLAGEGEQTEWLVYDLGQRRVLQREKALGPVRRLAPLSSE